MGTGLTVPPVRGTGSVGFFQVTGDEISAAREDLRLLFVTNWGERPMHFKFGANLREFLFEQSRDDVLRGRIADRISDQVATWLPFLRIDQLFIVFSDEDPTLPSNSFKIVVGFSLRSRPFAGTATLIHIVRQ
jgi:phage baseplate assembly protein W